MAGNHLETLVAEWYEFRGYFVRRNVQIGKRPNGGYDCELDIVAFHPRDKSLIHIEPSLDSDSWTKREQRYKKKFDCGRKHIPSMFPGILIPEQPDQIALLVYAGRNAPKELGGGRVLLIHDFMEEVRAGIRNRKVNSAAVPEGFPLLRTLQFASQYWCDPRSD